MGKNFIFITLEGAVQRILDEMISVEDIGKIYTEVCLTRESIPEFLTNNKSNFIIEYARKQVVGERDENCIPNFETTRRKIRLNFKAARERKPNERTEEIWNQLYERMKKILEKLWDEKKIVPTRYKIPEELESIIVNATPIQIENGYYEHFPTKGDANREVAYINGKYYLDCDIYQRATFPSIRGNKFSFFNSDLELLAYEIEGGIDRMGFIDEYYCDPAWREERKFFLQEFLPQYRDLIDQVFSTLNKQGDEGFIKPNTTTIRINDFLIPKQETGKSPITGLPISTVANAVERVGSDPIHSPEKLIPEQE